MFETHQIEEIARKLQGFLPGGAESAQALRTEFRAALEVALEAAVARMDLVTREEFEVQTALLERAYTRIEALESELGVTTEPSDRSRG